MNVIIWYYREATSFFFPNVHVHLLSESLKNSFGGFQRIQSLIRTRQSPLSEKPREIAATKSVIYLRSTSTFHDDYIKVDVVKFSQVYMWRLSIKTSIPVGWYWWRTSFWKIHAIVNFLEIQPSEQNIHWHLPFQNWKIMQDLPQISSVGIRFIVAYLDLLHFCVLYRAFFY